MQYMQYMQHMQYMQYITGRCMHTLQADTCTLTISVIAIQHNTGIGGRRTQDFDPTTNPHRFDMPAQHGKGSHPRRKRRGGRKRRRRREWFLQSVLRRSDRQQHLSQCRSDGPGPRIRMGHQPSYQHDFIVCFRRIGFARPKTIIAILVFSWWPVACFGCALWCGCALFAGRTQQLQRLLAFLEFGQHVRRHGLAVVLFLFPLLFFVDDRHRLMLGQRTFLFGCSQFIRVGQQPI